MTDEEAKAMLDAARNENGKAFIPGVGYSYIGFYDEKRYVIGKFFRSVGENLMRNPGAIKLGGVDAYFAKWAKE